MNPDAKKEFVAELRSGRWRQIAGVFCDTSDGRCIAGVLCEAYRRVTGLGNFVLDQRLSDMNKMNSYRYDGGTPKKWAGLEEQGSRSIIYEGERVDISILSDAGVPFDILAGLIEMQL